MEMVIGILTGGLVCMALLVVVQSRNVLRRNQRPPDQALVSMVQDLVTAVLAAKRPSRPGREWTPTAVDMAASDMRPGDESVDPADSAVQVARMGPIGS